LGHIFDHGESTSHVSVERRIARGHLTFVACGQDEPTEFIRERHENITSDPCLKVFLSHVLLGICKHTAHGVEIGIERLMDGDGYHRNAEAPRKFDGIIAALIGTVLRRHEYAEYVLVPDSGDGYGGYQRRIDAA